MSGRDEVRRTREILEVRVLQRRAAEQQVEREAARCRSLDDARDESLSRLAALHESWSASITGATLGLTMAGAWSVALGREFDGLSQLDLDIAEAQDDRRSAAEAWRGAMAREEAADTLTRMTARRARRRAEEFVLGEVADSIARRSPV